MRFTISEYNKKALTGGLITAIMTAAGILLIGNVSNMKQRN